MRGRRIDWLIHILLNNVADYYLHKQLEKRGGFQRNLNFKKRVRDSGHKAAAVLTSDVTLPAGQGMAAFVRSASQPSTSYTVANPGTPSIRCTCPYSERGNLCKHAVKANSFPHKVVPSSCLTGYSRKK